MNTHINHRSERLSSFFGKVAWLLLGVFVLLNAIACLHAYHFTHFSETDAEKTNSPDSLSLPQKTKALLLGVRNPRPENDVTPNVPYETIYLNSNRKIACWHIETKPVKGTVILFHGYGGKKADLLDKATIFRQLGYNTLLVDFMGSGGSEGNQTTIGFFEAEQVKTAYHYLRKRGEKNLFLFGTSMGAAAILKALQDDKITPTACLLECPFGSMYRTVCNRFDMMGIPSFPMAGLLIFWGGVQNGFWAFGHNPASYASQHTIPTLLIHGLKDPKVSKEEITELFNNLTSPKTLKIYPEAGHNDYLLNYRKEWTNDVNSFLLQYQ